MKSRKAIDIGAEGELNEFMDQFFYNKIRKCKNILDIVRIQDKFLQLKGIDLIVTTTDQIFEIDEKAQLYYINCSLPTFAFEVEFINRKSEVCEGWLINSTLKNNYYMLIWPFANHKNLKEIKKDDFSKIECLLIEKSEVLNFLKSKGWTFSKIKDEIEFIKQNNLFGRINIPNEQDFFFFHSNPANYIEEPINIVIYKRILLNLCRHQYVITKNSIEIIK